jgi:hypothetical protein
MKRLLSISIAVGLALALSAPGMAAQSGAIVSVKATGLSEKGASDRVARKLNRQINRWAHENKFTKVRVGVAHAACTKGAGGLFTCTRSARVAG